MSNRTHSVGFSPHVLMLYVGPSLASKITTAGNKTYKSFLNEPSAHEFTFNKITGVDVLNIIDKLPSKASSGVDGISPILLKHIKKRNM